METFLSFVQQHAPHAHWYIFFGILLAGMNVPISTDLLILVGAVLASQFVPQHTALLFFAILFGCLFSAWIAYWFGRLIGPKLGTLPRIGKLFQAEKLHTMHAFYQRYGLWTLVVGRFIPFGVRNCLFMGSGMSRVPFGQFALRDAVACPFWCSASFFTFYLIGKNYLVLYRYLKAFNLLIFGMFLSAVALFLYFKMRKKRKSDTLSDL